MARLPSLAKTALAAVKLDDNLVQIFAGHLRPELVHENELCVGDLEKQEVANAKLS